MVNKYKNLKLETDERYNLALFGLWKAYNSYDEERGANFLTHATNVGIGGTCRIIVLC